LIKSGAKVKSDVKICMYEVWSTLGLVNSFVDISEVAEEIANSTNSELIQTMGNKIKLFRARKNSKGD
jgi:RNA-binding protein YhbY